jgi:hypothetical protein
MAVTDQEKALRTHPITADQLLHAIKAVIESKMEAVFLRDFANAFVLASDQDIGRLTNLINTHGDQSNFSVQRVGRERC